MSREISEEYWSNDNGRKIREASKIEGTHDLPEYHGKGGVASTGERGDVCAQNDLTFVHGNVGCLKDKAKQGAGRHISKSSRHSAFTVTTVGIEDRVNTE